MANENFKITLQVLQVWTQKVHSNPVSALCEWWLQCIAAVMQGGFPHCKITAAKSAIPFCRKIKINFFPNVLAGCCYIIIAAVPYPRRRSKPWNPILSPALQCQDLQFPWIPLMQVSMWLSNIAFHLLLTWLCKLWLQPIQKLCQRLFPSLFVLPRSLCAVQLESEQTLFSQTSSQF